MTLMRPHRAFSPRHPRFVAVVAMVAAIAGAAISGNIAMGNRHDVRRATSAALFGDPARAAYLFSSAREANRLTDASALRLQQFDETRNEQLALDALVLADSALAIDESLSEAHFNRALAL